MPTRAEKEKAAEEAANRIPVTVVTGFLGSGKTTLVNRILKERHGRRIAVIENEFGEVGVDDGLVLNSQEEIFEMNNGCICCTVRGDLIKIMHKLQKRNPKIHSVLVETTGLADPAPVAQTFFVDDFVQEHYRLDAIITVVDAKHLVQHLDDQKPEGVENEAIEQLAFADRVLLNKVDLVTDEEKAEVVRRIKGINGAAEIIETVQSSVALERILDVNAFSLERILQEEPDFLESDGDHQHDASVGSVGIQLEGELDMDKLNAWLSKLLKDKGADIFRSKGILAVDGTDDKQVLRKYVFQGVHMLMGFASSADGVGKPWQPEEKRVSRLVFIGRNLNREDLNASFKACLA
ncbi:COBW domain-containing protein 1 [Tetrabaena socialis]|uniref:COBW domain-containing protein 1 n=1 Tax=Tetrabaena socialis TaxID=47790 RepID=A0A2J8AHY3_9CHLO|nr:COBW domain-containing protein 1 [Tetrabaena socialis]|eukprot:PNH12128.1 COBW domain-containing protein 1 [Tetrabaena socialis]